MVSKLSCNFNKNDSHIFKKEVNLFVNEANVDNFIANLRVMHAKKGAKRKIRFYTSKAKNSPRIRLIVNFNSLKKK